MTPTTAATATTPARSTGGSGGEQFTVNPSATPGRVLFDRTGPTPPGPFNIDIGTTELLRLNAGGGDDTITGAKKGLAGLIVSELNGDDGNDAIRGTDAADRLNGGAGRDLLQSRDKAEDLVDCGPGSTSRSPTSATSCAAATSSSAALGGSACRPGRSWPSAGSPPCG